MSSEIKLLTNELLVSLKNFSGYKYSPEKNKIIYLTSQSDIKENKSKKELYIMNPDGSDIKLISSPDESIAEPNFILKGEKIVYLSNGVLYFMNLDGTNKKKIICNESDINTKIEGFLLNENLDKIILIKLVKLENSHVKIGNDVYKDCDKASQCYIADDLCYTHWKTLQNEIQRPFIYNAK